MVMVKGCKECLLTQSVNIKCGHPTMVCNHMVINHVDRMQIFNLLLLKSIQTAGNKSSGI